MCLAFAFITEHMLFGKRYDKNPNIKYFTAEDFNLSAECILLKKGLNGYVYKKEDVVSNKKYIIFCHGMGAGHIAYTTEIAYFCNHGYTVLAVDSRGCNFSDGKNLKGMYSGVETAVAAIDYAQNNFNNPDGKLKIYLVGHSWGGYSALCASAKRKVDGVVAISAPSTPSRTMRDGAAPIISKPIATVLQPFWWLVNFFKYGAKGNSNAAKCAKISGVPTLLIHGDKDNTVKLKSSAFGKADGNNITRMLAKGKAHNPYNTENAEKLLTILSAQIAKGEKDFSLFDFKGATEEDEEVMCAITKFIENKAN